MTNGSSHNDFTKEQLEYVNSIPADAELLRGHLLHQVRLRDIIEGERDYWERQTSANINKGKQEAIEFAEWMAQEDYDLYDGVGRWISPTQSMTVYTTEQLYNLFLQSKEKKDNEY